MRRQTQSCCSTCACAVCATGRHKHLICGCFGMKFRIVLKLHNAKLLGLRMGELTDSMSHWLPPALNRSSEGERSRSIHTKFDFLHRTYHSVHDLVRRLSLIMKEHLQNFLWVGSVENLLQSGGTYAVPPPPPSPHFNYCVYVIIFKM